MLQMDLMSYFSTESVATPQPQPEKSAYSIKHDPLKGFKVVPAPGLTTKASPNPCLDCGKFGEDMNECSEHCIRLDARQHYLRSIGIELMSGVSGDGYYGVGS